MCKTFFEFLGILNLSHSPVTISTIKSEMFNENSQEFVEAHIDHNETLVDQNMGVENEGE